MMEGDNAQFGILGLGLMGRNLAQNLLSQNTEIALYSYNAAELEAMAKLQSEFGNMQLAGTLEDFVTGIAKRWIYWWKEDVWKDDPMKPWDPMEDESDDTEDGRKPPAKKKKKSGYSKRAGG
jgi:hypothetical protein